MSLKKREKELLASYYRTQEAKAKRCFPLRAADKKENDHLEDVGLLVVSSPQGPLAQLTERGTELGRIYSGSWWGKSGLWYREHIKDHWISLVLGLLGGVLGALLVKWLCND